MKNVSIFGRSIPLVALLVVGILVTGASAAVVGYLSNTVTADVKVDSPYFLEIRTPTGGDMNDAGYWDGNWGETINLGNHYGGEEFVVEYKLVNNANVKVYADVQMEVMCEEGFDANNPDFSSVTLLRSDYPNSPIDFGITQGSNSHRVLYTTDDAGTYNNPSETTYGNITFVVKNDALGTYTIEGNLIPDMP